MFEKVNMKGRSGKCNVKKLKDDFNTSIDIKIGGENKSYLTR